MQSSLCFHAVTVGGITRGIVCRRCCPERFAHPALPVPTRRRGI